jgi:hypothetical protein
VTVLFLDFLTHAFSALSLKEAQLVLFLFVRLPPHKSKISSTKTHHVKSMTPHTFRAPMTPFDISDTVSFAITPSHNSSCPTSPNHRFAHHEN